MQGTVVSVDVAVGDTVAAGQQVLVLESMKMEHVIAANSTGVVEDIAVAVGQTVYPGDLLVTLGDAPADFVREHPPEEGVFSDKVDDGVHAAGSGRGCRAGTRGDGRPRPDAWRVAARPAAHDSRERRRLLDPGSFVEYGPVVIARNDGRRELQTSSSARRRRAGGGDRRV